MSSPTKVVVIVDAPGYSSKFVDVAMVCFEEWKASHISNHDGGGYNLGNRTTEAFFESIISGKCHYSGAEGDSLAFVFDANYGSLDAEDRDNILYVIGDLLRRRANFEDHEWDHWSAMVFCHGYSADACAWKIDVDSKYEPLELGRMSFNFKRKEP